MNARAAPFGSQTEQPASGSNVQKGLVRQTSTIEKTSEGLFRPANPVFVEHSEVLSPILAEREPLARLNFL